MVIHGTVGPCGRRFGLHAVAPVGQRKCVKVKFHRRPGRPMVQRRQECLERILQRAIVPVPLVGRFDVRLLRAVQAAGQQHDVEPDDAHVLLASRDPVQNGVGLGEPSEVEAQLGEGLALDGVLPGVVDGGVAGGTADAAPASEDPEYGWRLAGAI